MQAKSKSELGEIIDNGRYSNSAVEAAAALLRQKLKMKQELTRNGQSLMKFISHTL